MSTFRPSRFLKMLFSPFLPNKADEILWKAVMSGDVEGVKSALADGAFIDVPFVLSAEERVTPLQYVAQYGPDCMVALLAELGANINIRTSQQWGMPPVMVAAYYGRVDALRHLISHGTDLTYRTLEGHSIVDVAGGGPQKPEITARVRAVLHEAGLDVPPPADPPETGDPPAP